MIKYKIEETGYGFRVVELDPVVHVTTIENGETTTLVQSRRAMFGKYGYTPENNPLFAAAWRKESRMWHVDVDCGARRWRGYQSSRAVHEALRKCKVEKRDAQKIMRKAKKLNGQFAPQVY